MKARLTPHQKDTLRRFEGAARRSRDGWVRADAFGSPAALAHLLAKGYLERDFEVGPRGGQHPKYRLAGGHIELGGDIDTALIQARKAERVVRIFTKDGSEYRGVPGEVARIDDWKKTKTTLVLTIGQRQVPLLDITKVVA